MLSSIKKWLGFGVETVKPPEAPYKIEAPEVAITVTKEVISKESVVKPTVEAKVKSAGKKAAKSPSAASKNRAVSGTTTPRKRTKKTTSE